VTLVAAGQPDTCVMRRAVLQLLRAGHRSGESGVHGLAGPSPSPLWAVSSRLRLSDAAIAAAKPMITGGQKVGAGGWVARKMAGNRKVLLCVDAHVLT
jgi:hypothetical protein